MTLRQPRIFRSSPGLHELQKLLSNSGQLWKGEKLGPMDLGSVMPGKAHLPLSATLSPGLQGLRWDVSLAQRAQRAKQRVFAHADKKAER